MKTRSIRRRLAILGGVVLFIGIALVAGRGYVSGPGLLASFDAEFFGRPDGYPGLVETYDLQFNRAPIQMDPGLKYRALADGYVDVVDAYATDGRIQAYDLLVLEDDKNFFPPYHAAPVLNGETLERWPELRPLLNQLGGLIDNERMQAMNYAVDETGRLASEVAHDFLARENLLAGPQIDLDPDTFSIGGKPFTEQAVLGEIIAQLIEARTPLSIERRFNLGGTLICFQALKSGGIDCYVEYTGTALMSIIEHDLVTDADWAYQIVRDEFEERWGLVWLDPFGLNNAYTLTMRKQHAQELGIETISDLAEYLAGIRQE